MCFVRSFALDDADVDSHIDPCSGFVSTNVRLVFNTREVFLRTDPLTHSQMTRSDCRPALMPVAKSAQVPFRDHTALTSQLVGDFSKSYFDAMVG